MKKSEIVTSTIAGILAIGLSAGASQVVASEHIEMEKCYGVVKASKNDCGTPNHACAAQAKTDGDKSEWIFLPKGSCEKLVNGSTSADNKEES